MTLSIDRFTRSEWAQWSEKAHLICFQERKPAEWDRIDFALVVKNEERLLGYVTCREIDHETLYWQFGGAFPGTKETALSYKVHLRLIEACKAHYKRIVFFVENTNTPMLKMALKSGFRIFGTRFHAGSVLVEHVLEFE